MLRRSLVQKILIVDDDADVAWSLAAVIKHDLGCEVRTAEGGAEAVDQASDMRPDVILMDISMPHIDGIEVARLLRTLFPSTSVPRLIALTGLNAPEHRRRILENGFDACLSKPVDLDVLLSLLRGQNSA
jgi:CheY-like chemotaxis protein